MVGLLLHARKVLRTEGALAFYDGLPAAMLSSGVPRIVSTLWRVSDVASALLISEMYTRLYQHVGELSVAAALRGAQIWLRELPWGEAEATLETAKMAREAEPKGETR